MSAFIAFIHVLCGVSFLGIALASFVYIAKSIRKKNAALLRYAIKTSLFGDAVLLPIIIIQILTGTYLVFHHHIPPSTPWIRVAYVLFSLVGLIWFLLLLIKLENLSSNTFHYKKIFYTLNIVMIILFCLIIHDAVTQQTWFYQGGW